MLTVKYYYFAASLPMISMDAPPPFPFRVFHDRCRDHLNAADRTAVDLIARGDDTEPVPATPFFLQRRRAAENQILNAVAVRRAAADDNNNLPLRHTYGCFRMDIEQAVEAAFAQTSPLERERLLDSLRWELLEEFGGTDQFANDAVLSYACRLRLSERWAALTRAAGQKRFAETAARITSSEKRGNTEEKPAPEQP